VWEPCATEIVRTICAHGALREWFDDFWRAVLEFCVCLVGSLKDVQLAK